MHGTLSDQSLIYLQIAQMLEDDILQHLSDLEIDRSDAGG